MDIPKARIQKHLTLLYGQAEADRIWPQLRERLDDFRQRCPHLQDAAPPEQRLTERDAILITYADQFRAPDAPPLATLCDFAEAHLGDAISGVHLLPFYPYSSDDGFSVIDYREVDPDAGSWEDAARLGRKYRLMLDAVINHISRQSDWFQQYLRGEGPYTDYFIEISPETDLSYVVRPRALPLLTPVPALGADGVDGDHGARAEGVRYVWTTFSDDQIDLNYTNPQVLLEIIDVLLFYVSQGAEIIRLDAIAYLWKELDTSCIHLPQTHAVVKLWRAVLDMVAPGVILITETNVPHEENISYFGDEGDEAQMVYQFPLGPLVLHAFHTGNARKLTEWAASLETPSPNTTFFNFIASHDGIGIRPAEGILTPDEVDALVNRTLTHGGQVSYKNNPDGSRSVYELNITLYDWLNNPNQPVSETDVRRFLASQAIMLSLAGVPGIYVHSLFGSRNCHPCVAETGRARSINREKFSSAALEAILNDPGSHQSQVLSGYLRMLHQRREHPAFHPNGANGGQKALSLHDGVFGILRTAPDRSETVLCLVNVSGEKIRVEVDVAGLGGNAHRVSWTDLMGGEEIAVRGGTLKIFLDAYQAVWLTV